VIEEKISKQEIIKTIKRMKVGELIGFQGDTYLKTNGGLLKCVSMRPTINLIQEEKYFNIKYVYKF